MGVLRLVLAVSVVLTHSTAIAGQQLVGGATAVQCFFVISGFYMALVLDRKYNRLKQDRWRTFMTARLFRLFPVYIAVLLATLGGEVVLMLLGREPNTLGHLDELSLVSLLALGAVNLLILGQDLVLFTGVDSSGSLFLTSDFHMVETPAWPFMLVSPAWSISLELMFYALAPWLTRWRTRSLVLLALASLALRAGLMTAGLDHDPWTYRFFPTELVFFLFGVFAYRFGLQRQSRSAQRPWVGPTALAVLLLAFLAHETVTDLVDEAGLLFPVLVACVVPLLFRWTQHSAWDRQIGELSYPLYLVHVLVLSVLVALGLPHQGLVLVPVALLAAVALRVVVDAPAERMRQRRIDRALGRTDAPSGVQQAEAPAGA